MSQQEPVYVNAALKRLKFPELSDEQFADVLEECRQRKLDPWSDHVCARIEHDLASRLPRVRLLLKIQGLRSLARATGQYKGRKGPFWRGLEHPKWSRHWDADAPPAMARVGVYRDGDVEPTWGTAHWRAFAVEGDPFWQKMGPHMLAKCAEADALRAAFPELSGLFTPEEMQQARTPAAPQRMRIVREDGTEIDLSSAQVSPWETAGRA